MEVQINNTDKLEISVYPNVKLNYVWDENKVNITTASFITDHLQLESR
jgi:hypothetical protein